MSGETAVLLTFSGIAAVCFVCGFAAGRKVAGEQLRSSAIESGAGQWTIDPVTGQKKFEWISSDPTGPIEKREIENRYPNGK